MAERLITRAEIFAALEERRSILAPTHREMGVDQDFDTWTAEFAAQKGGRYMLGLPKDFEPWYPPIAHVGVDIGVNNIMTGERAAVTVTLSEGDYQNTAAGRKKLKEDKRYLEERFGALLYAIGTYSTEDPWRDLVRKCLALGLGAITYSVAYSRWAEPPFGKDRRGKPREGRNAAERAEYRAWQDKRNRTLAFDVQSVHPRNLFFDPHHDPPQDFIREEYISWKQAEREHPELDYWRRTLAGEAQPDQVVRVIYCSETAYACYLGDEAVTPPSMKPNAEGIAKNTSGLLFHRMAYSGFGDKDERGNFVYRLKGIIRDTRDTIVAYVGSLNQVDAMRQEYAFGGVDIDPGNGDTNEIKAQMSDYGRGPGVKNFLPNGVRIIPQATPAVPPVLFQEMDRQERFLEISYGPEILRGIREPGETAAGQRSRTTIAQGPYRSVKQNTQQLVAATLMDLAWLVKYEIKEPVPVLMGGMMLDPERIPAHPYMVEVDWSPLTEEERAFRSQDVMKRLEAGLLTQEGAIREIEGLVDAHERVVEVRAERIMDAILAGPGVLTALEQEFLKSIGLGAPASPASDVTSAQGLSQPEAALPPAVSQNGVQPLAEPTLGSQQETADQVSRYFGMPIGAPQPGPGP